MYEGVLKSAQDFFFFFVGGRLFAWVEFFSTPLYVLTYTIAFSFISCLPHFVAHINKKFKKEYQIQP